MRADLIPILGTVIGAAGALAALMVALAAWLRADIRALETDVRADIRALDGLVNVLVERMSDLGERVARLETRPDLRARSEHSMLRAGRGESQSEFR